MIALIQMLAQFGNNGFKPPVDNSPYYSGDPATSEGALDSVEIMISNAIGLLTILAGIFFIFYFILASINWILAAGDAGKIQKSRDQMVQGVLGLVLVVASYAIVGLVGTLVGIDLLNPAEQIQAIIEGSGAL